MVDCVNKLQDYDRPPGASEPIERDNSITYSTGVIPFACLASIIVNHIVLRM